MHDEIRMAPPDPARLSSVDRLCKLGSPYEKDDELFVAAMREIVLWHTERSHFYGRLVEGRGFSADSLESVASCSDIPFIHANFFKRHELLSIPKSEVALHLTSSGTSGQRSQIFFDTWSIESARAMVGRVFSHYGWHTPDRPANYLIFNYEISADSKIGTAHTNVFLTRFAPVHRSHFALRPIGGGNFEFDFFGCVRALQEYAEEGLPVRILGFPAFLHTTLERMAAMGIKPLHLTEDSLIFLGGGWKKDAARMISREDLAQAVEDRLGIPHQRVRDGYGAVEHAVPYIECEHRHFHVPAWSRLFVRDVATLAPLPAGETGFLNFVSPYITSVPAHSVLMGDLGEWGEHCPCGLASPYFLLRGRAGTSRNRSCAIAAAELLGRAK